MHVCMHACMHACMRVYICIYVGCVCLRLFLYVYLCNYITCTYLYLYQYLYGYLYLYLYLQIDLYLYRRTGSLLRFPQSEEVQKNSPSKKAKVAAILTYLWDAVIGAGGALQAAKTSGPGCALRRACRPGQSSASAPCAALATEGAATRCPGCLAVLGKNRPGSSTAVPSLALLWSAIVGLGVDRLHSPEAFI